MTLLYSGFLLHWGDYFQLLAIPPGFYFFQNDTFIQTFFAVEFFGCKYFFYWLWSIKDKKLALLLP